MEKIEIKDNSGDRGYFTIIPNYILNHSTAIDQALYLQMKRIAGEDGHCFATEQTLRKKLGIGRQAFQKSLKYLIDHKWISFVGLTGGKTRPIKTYKINNIWHLNEEYYKKISSRTALSSGEIVSETTEDSVQNSTKIVSRTALEEEQHKEEPLRRTIIAAETAAGNETNQLIELFRPVNPVIDKYFKNTTQRQAIERMIKIFGREKMEEMIKALPLVNAKPYWKKSTTPFELENNLPHYQAKSQEEKQKSKESKISFN